jgi:type II secretory pathway pseudopilin PulG
MSGRPEEAPAVGWTRRSTGVEADGAPIGASADTRDDGDEAGAILILAIAFLLVVSVLVAALANWTMNNLNNTVQFQHAGSRLYAAEGATQVALRASRYTYPPNNSDGTSYTWGTGYQCPGETTPLASVNGLYVEDWCVTTKINPTASGTTYTRMVTLTACQVPSANSTLSAVCTGSAVLLTAVVYVDDHNPAEDGLNTCSASAANPSTCGYAMTIESWAPGT